MKHSIIKNITILTFFALACFGCASNEQIPNDLTAQQLIQQGQTAFEHSDYKLSLRYYNAVLERFPDDRAVCTESKYEIGHLYMKQKKYEAAKPIFQELLDLYANTLPGELPPAYQKLAQIEMEKIEKR